MPHEPVWNENDGQSFANIAHTLTSKGVVQSLVVFSAVIGLTVYITPASEPGYGIWPRTWPMWTQVILAGGRGGVRILLGPPPSRMNGRGCGASTPCITA